MVIGGVGFIGCNAARRFLQRGDRVLVVDNLARRGSRANLEWLRGQGDVDFTQCDIRDYGQLTEVFANYRNVDVVVHLAAQVAVTTSVEEPREDFDINALGTFNVLEAVRNGTSDPLLIFASTNKVYGGMEDIKIVPAQGAVEDEKEGRYIYRDLPGGIPENRLLDFHSPYGCSKGAADQYVHARSPEPQDTGHCQRFHAELPERRQRLVHVHFGPDHHALRLPSVVHGRTWRLYAVGAPVLGVLRVRVRCDGGDDSFRLPGHTWGRQGARLLEKVNR